MAKGKYPTWSDAEHLLLIEGWARDGLTDALIAENIGIRRPTLYDWKKKHSDIADALKAGKEVIDRKVENALLKKALGMTTTEKQYRMVKLDDDVLNMRRLRFANQFKLDNPEATQKEIKMAAIDGVETYERIQIYETVHELAPDASALMFWLKNRKPEQYRDKSFQELNKAQAEKALVELRKAAAEADISELKLKVMQDGDNSVAIEDKLSQYFGALEGVVENKEDKTNGSEEDAAD